MSMGHTGLVSKGVSNKNAIRMFRVLPFQSDGIHIWLANFEIPWGTGYLRERWGKKEKRKRNHKITLLIYILFEIICT